MLTLRRTAGALIAVTIGIALVTTALLLLVSGRPQTPDRWVGAAVVVQARPAHSPADPFPPAVPWPGAHADELGGRLAALPGVTAAVPDRSFYAQAIVDGRPVESAVPASGWSSARLGGVRLTSGAPPRQAGEVVVDEALGLRPGDLMTLLTAAGPERHRVTGLADAPGVLVPDRVAARFAPGVTAIGLVLEPGADTGAVAAAAGRIVGTDGEVLTGDGRGALEPRGDARTRWIGMQVLTGVAVLTGFVTVFVVASTFAFTVAQRRRELGLLRTVGATPRQVRRLVQREALLVGGAGAVLGVLAGAALSPAAARLLVTAGFEPAGYQVRFAALPILAALLLGPLVALAGAGSAARRAARVRPLEALREAAVEQRRMGRARWTAGGVSLAAGVALAVATAASDDAQQGATYVLYAAMALIVGMATLAPATIPPLLRLWRGGGAIGMLVRESTLTATRRTASTAAPVLLTVAFAVLVSGMVRTSAAAYAAGRAADVATGRVLVPEHTPGLSDAAVSGAAGAAILPATVFGPDRRALNAIGVDPRAFVATDRAADVVAGALDGLHAADTVVVTESARLAVGAACPVTFADGQTVSLRVVGVVADRSIRGDLLMSRATVRHHDPSALTAAVHLTGDAAAGPGARVIDVATWAAEADRAEDRLVWLFTLMLIAVSAGYGAIAVANTLLMAAAGRAPDLRVIRLAGATRRQVTGYLAAESALVVAIGTMLGGLVAAGALLAVRAGLSEQTGAPVPLVLSWPVIAGVVGLCLLLGLLASVLPARAGSVGRRAPDAADRALG
ncbi:putative ABC transport system permease protein [Actinoplanes octamycinicus]|uniref:Putative ABC transport system permease protein n=1 Tax=Actinoplanes octamycinicus TaxID=135948 RepID=A0A7W7M8R8_9ACTN|nr:FtsX-like permease family protein [Actinoplanes octamycinicus]MBB4741243.1 putative ABC transport system permease protein [Actinoplanes octamycinicus]GIE56151.1 hypothetical protein Aoc01nite_15530 [Actinoplanes octamycinicus]